jgi:hypothetical protein
MDKESIILKLNKNLVIPFYVIAVLSILSFFRGCSNSSDNAKMRKEVDALRIEMQNHPTHKELQIEGLRNEKRMIQATDRKLLDIQRQTQIEEEIKKLDTSK